MPAPALFALLLAGSLVPLLLGWALLAPARPWPDEIAAAAGLIGFAALLAGAWLSGRFRPVTAGIGVDRTLRWHQLLGRVAAVALLLVHPFLYALPDGPAVLRPDDPTRAGALGLTAAAVTTGLIAWLLLSVLTVTAIRRDDLPQRYETWRASHAAGSLLFAALGLHHAWLAGRYSQHPAVSGSLATLAVLLAVALCWTWLVRPLSRARRPWRIAAVRPVARALWEVEIAPVGHPGLDFRAGQFAWLRLDRGPFSWREHPFSIASAPEDGPALRFLIKEAGDFTDGIGRLAPGARAYVDGPHGHLGRDDRQAPGLVFLCGGVGIAPALSLLRSPAARGDPRPMQLLHGNRLDAQRLPHALAPLQAALRLDLIEVLGEPPPGWSGEVGRLDAARIARLCAGPAAAGWLFVLCGPPPMLREAEAALRRLGVPRRRIRSERFRYA